MDTAVHERREVGGHGHQYTESTAFVEQIVTHPFLVRCRTGGITPLELDNFLVQHGKYAGYFTRYLCALMSQLDDARDVSCLAENLSEELGYGEAGGVPHARLYADMLRDFNLSLDEHPTYPETQNLVDVMFMLCRQPGGLAGLGALCLGAEAIVPAVYSSIIEGFQSRGIAVERLRFFSIHVDCDDDHAGTMYAIIERKTSQSRANRLAVSSAAEIAINARLRFFDALSRGIQ